MVYLLYNTLLTLFLILAAPYLLVRCLLQKEFRRALYQRMGFVSVKPHDRCAWVHAASVGEVLCSVPLLRRIKEELPELRIIMTTVTPTGNETAKAHIPEAESVFFFPIDHPFALQRLLKKIRPSILLIAETEFWPNLLWICGRKGIPIVLFNGRVSERSFRGYLFFKFLFERCLNHLSLCLMQTSGDRDRIIRIGAPPDRTRVVGNLKFDVPVPRVGEETKAALAQSLGLLGSEPIFIAGSTHSGEEEVLIRLWKELKEVQPDLIFILAPRHLHRLEEVEGVLRRESLSWVRRTSLSRDGDGRGERRAEVILLDTMGELGGLYSLATVVFIGGSLVPVGGHNPLEPLFFRKCVLFGPFMFHFSEIARQLIEEGGAVQVKDAEDLASHLRRLLRNERARRDTGERGYQFLRKHQGATERMFLEIRPYLTEIRELGCPLSNEKH